LEKEKRTEQEKEARKEKIKQSFDKLVAQNGKALEKLSKE